jgi:hypothetical protein
MEGRHRAQSRSRFRREPDLLIIELSVTQDQIPLAILIAVISGFVAGLLTFRSRKAGWVAMGVVILLSVFGPTIYGYSLHLRNGASFTFIQIVSGFLLALPGVLLFFGLPAAGACMLTAALCRQWRQHQP